MTPPLLILGLYLGLLAFSLALSSWVGHFSPATEAARRVTDAAERAALSILLAPAKLAAASAIGASAVYASWALYREGPVLWTLLGTLLVPVLTLAGLFYSAKKILRATGQLVEVTGVDETASLSSRASLGAVLCVESTLGLVLLGLHHLAASEIGASEGLRVIAATSASIAVVTLVFARSLASAAMSTDIGESPQPSAPSPASLARLLSRAFHTPLIRLLTLVSLSSLGHSLLLSPMVGDDSAWLYFHLLKLLGLFALTFAGFVVRSSEDEHASHGWTRGLVVFLLLMLAGTWTLGVELSARAIPAGVSFLVLSWGLACWFAPQRTRTAAFSLLTRATSGFTALICFVGLALVLLVALDFAPSDLALDDSATLRISIAVGLAGSPLVAHWLLGTELLRGAAEAEHLTTLGPVPKNDAMAPSQRLVPFLALLSLGVGLAGLALEQSPLQSSSQFLGLSLGCFLGAAWATGLLGRLREASEKFQQKMASLVSRHQQLGTENEVNFEAGIEISRDASQKGILGWILFALLPLLLLTPIISGDSDLLISLALGAGLGSLLVGTGVEWLLSPAPEQAQRTMGSLSLLTGVVHITWILAAIAAFAPSSDPSPPPKKELQVVNDL